MEALSAELRYFYPFLSNALKIVWQMAIYQNIWIENGIIILSTEMAAGAVDVIGQILIQKIGCCVVCQITNANAKNFHVILSFEK